MTNQTAGCIPEKVSGMLADLMMKLGKGSISPQQFGLFLKKRSPFSWQEIRRQQLKEWALFYDKHGVVTYTKKLVVPDRVSNHEQLIVIPANFTISAAMDLCVRCGLGIGDGAGDCLWTNPTLPVRSSCEYSVLTDFEDDDVSPPTELAGKSLTTIRLLSSHFSVMNLVEYLCLSAFCWSSRGRALDYNGTSTLCGDLINDRAVKADSIGRFIDMRFADPDVFDGDAIARRVIV